ncbi:MAG: hypothetical protein K0B81_05580 [Candidatus Cloacimonetes bacterium]|nr:hypothetical protein [Candidatus Cloacimonadota bacterium]
MWKMINRILFFLSLFVLYIIFKELLFLIHYTQSIHPYLMYVILGIFTLLFIFLVVLPLVRIFAISKIYVVTDKLHKTPELRRKRIENFRKNNYLLQIGYDVDSIQDSEESYEQVIATLSKQCDLIRRKYVLRIFLSTGLSQNGFLDAFFILSGSISMIKEIFVLYHGRVPDRELFSILKKVYYSMAIGGSGLVEFAVEEFMSKMAGDFLKSVPFVNKIFTSLADGYVNAAIFTWVSLVTENYCKKIYISSDRDLYPSSKFFYDTFRNIVSEAMGLVKKRVFAGKATPDDFKENKRRNILHKILGINPIVS